MAAMARAHGVTPGTVSRWEAGILAAPHSAVRRYEDVLELEPNSLVAVLDTMNRYWSAERRSEPTLTRPPHREVNDPRLDVLLAAVADEGAMTGHDWDDLTAALAADPGIYLSRRTWARMTERLLSEMRIADGLNWHRRFEAFNRMMAHPAGQAAAIDACVTFGRETIGQGFVEVVSVLDNTGHADANSGILTQLENPSNPAAQLGALRGTIRKLKAGHFTPTQRRRIVELTRELPQGPAVAAVQRALTGSPPAPKSADTLRREEIVVSRIVNLCLGRLDQPLHDPILPVMVADMLFHPLSDAQLIATTLLAATPYKPALARALAIELTSGRTIPDQPAWAADLLSALQLLGGPAERRLAERLVMAEGVPTEVAQSAAFALAHIGGSTSPTYWLAAIERQANRWRRDKSQGCSDVLEGLAYGAGTTREWLAVRAIRDDTTLPAKARGIAGWWLNLPGEVTSGAML